jgi:hypothetical protein
MVLGSKSRKTPSLRFGPEPAFVVLKSGTSVSLREIVESRCQSLSSKYRPVWWLLKSVVPLVDRVSADDDVVDMGRRSTHSWAISPKLIRCGIKGKTSADLYALLANIFTLRRLLRVLDGGTLGLDFAPADASTVRDDAPIVVVQHGLTGGMCPGHPTMAYLCHHPGSHEAYVRAILAPACAPVEQGGLGYRAVVVNFRGCSCL